ncbi:MAG TPA: putative ABC exporter domain-containing protein [Opitutaceae bacterium]|nr:putative ABC exporter domain-containing protein [Opitutaceae bacterium]
MIGALLYLRLTSLRNLVVYRIRRLREPKYLIGTAVAIAYFYFVLLQRPAMRNVPAAGAAPAFAGAGMMGMAVLCVGLSALALVRVAFAWIAPADKPALRFSEPEIAFLFPAPVTRRTLIHFRLLSAQFAILFTSVLMAFFFNRFGYLGGNRALRAVGWWVILSTFDLHLNGTNLTLSRLKEKGSGFLPWRAAVIAAIVMYVLAVAWSAAAYASVFPPGDFSSARAMELFFRGLVHSSPLRWLVLPFRIAFGPYLAVGIREFCLAMVPALFLLALHYYWVSNTEASFEEGSIALAEKRAAAKAAAQRGELPKVGASKPRARSGPFPLSPQGPPEIAFLWKNLLSMRSSLLNRRTMLVTLWIVFCLAFGLRPLLAIQARSNGFDIYGPIIVMFCGMLAAYTLLLGPQVARQDLRNDLPNADILKTYPLEGWRLALGELLAPTAILTLLLWVSILVCAVAVDSRGTLPWLTPGLRVTVAVCMGSAAPFLCFIQLIVPNSIMVLMPGWYQASRSRGGGIEMFGQRLIFGVAQLLIALLVAAPAAGAAALIIFSSQWLFGVGPAVAIACAVVLAILAGEAAVGLWWLGWRFEKLDLSTEIR